MNFFYSHKLSVLSLNAIDLINEIFISIKNHNHSDLLNSQNQEFISLTKSYAKFIASIFYSDKKKNLAFCSGYKRMKYLFEQVSLIHKVLFLKVLNLISIKKRLMI